MHTNKWSNFERLRVGRSTIMSKSACMHLLDGGEEFREVCRSVSLSAILSGATDISPEAELIQRGHDTCTHTSKWSINAQKYKLGKAKCLNENSLDTSVSE